MASADAIRQTDTVTGDFSEGLAIPDAPSNPRSAPYLLGMTFKSSPIPMPAYVAPINTLPNELLVKILTQTWPSHRSVSFDPSSPRTNVPLVCSR